MLISPAFQRYEDICPDWSGFVDCLQKPLPTTLWVNTLAIDSQELMAKLECRDGEWQPLAWRSDAFRVPDSLRPARLPEYIAGFYHLQEEVSMIPPLLLDPQPGERILDLCAAPGNKTMQIALAMQNRGTVIGHDWNFNRLRILRTHSQRLGLSIISTSLGNGCQFKGADGFFDRVLVDAPCSCEGTVRKNPRIMFHGQQPGTLLYNGVQLSLLQKAIDACRPGGRIVYSTCTFRPEENEVIIHRILQKNPGLRVIPAAIPGLTASEGLTHFQGEEFDPSLRHAIRIWPHQNDSGGFFIAVLEKATDASSDDHRLMLTPRIVEIYPETQDLSVEKNNSCSGPDALKFLQERFDFPESVWQEQVIFHRSNKKLSYHPREHCVPAGMKLEELGQNLMKINFQFPKLSTAAARVLGQKARKNIVDLNRSQFRSYIAHEDLLLHASEATGIAEEGYVLIRYANRMMGLALAQKAEESFRLRSLFPKDWGQTTEKAEGELESPEL